MSLSLPSRTTLVGLSTAALLAACAAPRADTPAPMAPARDIVAATRLLEEGPALSTSAYQNAVDGEAERLAAGPLGREDAAAIAVLNDDSVRRTLAENLMLSDGFVRDLVRAQGDAGGPSVEWRALRLALARKETGARRDYGLAYAGAASAFVEAARDARVAWTEALAARQAEALTADATVSLKAEAELANEQYRAGTIPRGERARRQLALAVALRAHGEATAETIRTREALVRRLGLWGGAATTLALPDALPDLPETRPGTGGLEERALVRRLDLLAARHEGGSRGKAIAIRSEVREAAALRLLAYDAARHQRDIVVPEAEAVLEQAQRDYNGMLTDVFGLLEAVRGNLEEKRNLVAAVRDYWVADARLVAANGGPPESDDARTTMTEKKP